MVHLMVDRLFHPMALIQQQWMQHHCQSTSVWCTLAPMGWACCCLWHPLLDMVKGDIALWGDTHSMWRVLWQHHYSAFTMPSEAKILSMAFKQVFWKTLPAPWRTFYNRRSSVNREHQISERLCRTTGTPADALSKLKRLSHRSIITPNITGDVNGTRDEENTMSSPFSTSSSAHPGC